MPFSHLAGGRQSLRGTWLIRHGLPYQMAVGPTYVFFSTARPDKSDAAEEEDCHAVKSNVNYLSNEL